MAEGDADDRSDATGGGPGGGTTAPASGGAAQGAGGGAPSAPGQGTTDDDVIQIGPSAETPAKGGAGDDEVAKLKDKLSFLQPAHDGLSQAMKAVQGLHPELFGADGKYVGTQQTKPEEDVIQIGGAGAERPAAGARQTPPVRQHVGPQASPVDPQQAVWKETNLLARERLFTGGEDEQGDVVGAVATVLPGLLHEYGLTPEFLAQRGGGGIAPDQLAQIVDQRVMQGISRIESERAEVKNQIAHVAAQCPPGFFDQRARVGNSPRQTLADALPAIMAETRVPNVMGALLAHPATAAMTLNALVAPLVEQGVQKRISEQGGMQIMETGGGLPGAGNVTNSLEDIGASTTPPVR